MKHLREDTRNIKYLIKHLVATNNICEILEKEYYLTYFNVVRQSFMKKGNVEQVKNMTPEDYEYGYGEAYLAGKSGSEELIELVLASNNNDTMFKSIVSGASACGQIHVLKKYLTKKNLGIVITFAYTKKATATIRFLESKGYITNSYCYEMFLGLCHNGPDDHTLRKILCDQGNYENYFVAACAGGNLPLVKILGAFALVDKALEVAAKNGRLNIIKYLMAKGYELTDGQIEILFRQCRVKIILFLDSLGKLFTEKHFNIMKKYGYTHAAGVLEKRLNKD